MKTCGRAGHLILISCVIIVILVTIGLAVPPAGAETIVVSGPVTTHGHATITDTITVTNLHDLPEDAYVTYNAPAYGSFSDDGYAQTISGLTRTASITPVSVTDTHDSSGNLDIRYRQYKWALNGITGNSFTVTVTTSFDFTVTADPQPRVFSDPFASPGGVTAGATTLADAVDRIANYVKLNDPGNCMDRAGLMMSQLQSAGIQGRIVQGITYDTPITTPQFVYNGMGHQLSITWPKELHVWVEVYYPAEGRWVSYDPSLNKGFADHRHLAMGTSPTADSALYRVNVYANAGVSINRQTSMAFTGISDSGSYAFRYLDPAPAGLSVTGFPMGREMTARPAATPTPTTAPTPTPAPTPEPTVTPSPTPTPTPTPVPTQNATVTPSPIPGATATPAATQPPVHQDINLTPGGKTYLITGTLTDTDTGKPVSGVTITLDGEPVAIGPDGTFSIGAADGAHTLIAHAPGYETLTTHVVVSGGNLTQALALSQIQRTGGIPCCGLPLAILVLLIIGLYRYGRA